jgi:hypothetical protein
LFPDSALWIIFGYTKWYRNTILAEMFSLRPLFGEEQREIPLTSGSHSLFGSKCEETTEQTQVGISWPPISFQENALECTGFITALAKHQHAPAACGTAQPPAQWRGIEVVSLPLQVFINSLLI